MPDPVPEPAPEATSGAAPGPLSRSAEAALTMLAAWMGERYFRTFRRAAGDADDADDHADHADADAFDALLTQRERRVGVTVGALWEGGDLAGAREFEELLSDDVEEGGGYVLWVPPGADLPPEEPQRSEFRLLVAGALKGLAPGQRRELRIPVQMRLAKVQAEGAYVSVTGGLSGLWTRLSEGVEGAFHLDSRALHRLPEEEAELDIVISRVRDRAALLNAEEVTDVHVDDYWLVSRLPAPEPPGLTVVAAPSQFGAADGAMTRRLLRRHVRRAAEQREASECDLSVLLLVASLAHIDEEMATAALRGMSPAGYASLDLIALAGDGQLRQVLQPRTLAWEQ